MVAGVAHDVYATEVSHRRKHGVRTVQQGYLSFVVRSLGLHEEYVHACLVCGEFFCQLAERKVLGSFDNPQMEDFGLYNQVVGITDFLLNLRDFLTREARNDTVYQSSAYVAVLCEPGLELLVICAEVIFPQFDVLVDAFFQVMAVQENQFARHDDKTFALVALESFETTVQKLSQFARIRRCGSVGEFAIRVECNTGFRCVGDNETYLGLVGKRHECRVLRIRIQCAADTVDTRQVVDSLTVQTALQIDVVKTVLAVQPFCHTSFYGLNHYNATVEVGFLIHVVNNPVYKCTKEVTFTELDNSLGSNGLGSRLFV